MSNFFVGQIIMFGGNFAPRGFAFCNGQQMPIAQSEALFSLLGTAYGGDGINTFNLPNLQSTLPIHAGTGPGLSGYVLGQSVGVQGVTLTAQTMPSHGHSFNATTATATSAAITSSVVPGKPTAGSPPAFYALPGTPAPTPQALAPSTCGGAGGSQPHDNLMPSLCISFVIALEGLYPSSN